MKKTAAILLLVLLLFNLFGYRILFYYARQHSVTQLELSLDKELYSEADLITLKIPVSIPYQNERNEFERVDGEINIEGKIYRYVKRKIVDNHLILLCLPDKIQMKFEKAKADFFNHTTDITQNDGSKKADNGKVAHFNNGLNEFDQHTHEYTIFSFKLHLSNNKLMPVPKLVTTTRISPEQPPDAV